MVKEIDTTPDVNKAHEAAVEATQPDTFDFAAAVDGRSYPSFEVPVYLDEENVQKLLDLDRERARLELRVAKRVTVTESEDSETVKSIVPMPTDGQAEELQALDEKYTALVEQLRSDRYIVTVTGISPERNIEILDESYEKYPREFEESVHPLTNVPMKTEVENAERDTYYTARLRQEHITSIVAPNGAKDTSFADLNKVITTFRRLPALARMKIDQAINESTISVDFYDEIVDEVF